MTVKRPATTINPVPRIRPARVTPLNGKNQIEKIAIATDASASTSAMVECFIVILCLIVLL